MIDGFNSKIFYGVVESNQDPEFVGRVQVRVIGVHTDATVPNDQQGKGIPSGDLPWAAVMLPTTSGGLHGFMGHANLLPGAWVVGFTRDGELYNDLVILGTIPGIPGEANSGGSRGFEGQDGLWPHAEFVGEPDYPRVGRGGESSASFKTFKDARSSKKTDGESVQEPDISFGGGYQMARVYETPKGHVFIMDDTDGSEHIIIQNGVSSSYFDILSDGTIVVKSNKDSLDISVGDKKIHVGKDMIVEVSGDAEVKIGGKADIEVGGNVDLKVSGNVDAKVAGNLDASAATAKLTATGNATILSGGVVNISGAAGMNLTGGAGITLNGAFVRVNGKKIG